MSRISVAVKRAECLLKKKKKQQRIEDQILLAQIYMEQREKRWKVDEANEKENEFIENLLR